MGSARWGKTGGRAAGSVRAPLLSAAGDGEAGSAESPCGQGTDAAAQRAGAARRWGPGTGPEGLAVRYLPPPFLRGRALPRRSLRTEAKTCDRHGRHGRALPAAPGPVSYVTNPCPVLTAGPSAVV